MAGNGVVQVPPDSTGKQIDCSSLSAGGATVYRQRIVIADPTHSANLAVVSSGSLQVLVQNTVGISGQVSVTGSVAVSNIGAGTNHIGEVNISLMPAVALAAGAANIGSINNISAAVALAAGAAHIGEVNISLMPAVVLAAGTAHAGEFNISLMPAVVVTSITNAINVSTMPALAAGNNTVGAVTVAGFIDPSGNQRNVVDSANTALRVNVVAGGAGGGIASGPVAAGGSVTAGNNPVLMGGVDGGSLARILRVDATGGLIISNISATVNVAGSFTVGGQTGNGSATVGSTYTLIGGMDGSIGRVALTDAAGHFVITGTVALAAGTQHIGEVNISIMPAVALAAGAANIGTINNISAGVVLAAGAANIGSINNISANVNVVLQAGTANIGSINNISAAVGLAAGTQHIGEVNISLMPTVNVNLAAQSAGFTVAVSLGTAVVLAAGTNNIGTVQAISAAVSLVANTAYHPTGAPSASHGPKTVSMTASASVALVAAPGAATSIYVTGILATNGSATLTQLQIYEASATATPVISPFLAASGGGFAVQFDPPWRISANTALNARLKPSVGATVCVTLNFYVGA